MTPSEPQPLHSRANEIWRRFAGMFGADALDRKFGAKPPPEWIGMLARLDDRQVDRGIRRLAYSGKPHIPSLPEFTKLCRSVGGDDFDEGERAQVRLPSPQSSWRGDAWDSVANTFLLGHIAKRMKKDPRVYGRPASYQMLQATQADLDQLGIDKPDLDASPEFINRVHALVAAKNAWADDMRDLAVNGEVPPSTQKAVWHDLIDRAERS